MIEMMVRVDDVADRLVRHETLRFRDDGLPACLALPALDDGEMILELDHHARVAAENQVHAVGELL